MSKVEIPECSICLIELKNNLAVLDNCGHIFHQDCVADICECPICRCEIYEKIKVQGYELLEQDSEKLRSIQNDNIIYIQQLTQQKQQLSQQLNTKIHELDTQNKKINTLKNQINIQQQTMEKEKIDFQNQQIQKQNQIQELKRQNREQQDSQYEIMEQLMKKDNELESYKQLHKESQDNCKQLIQKINQKKENYEKLKTKYDQLKNKFNKISEISKPSSSPKKSDKKSEVITKKPVKIVDNKQIISKNKIKTPQLEENKKNNKKIVIQKVKPSKTISSNIDYKIKETHSKSKTDNSDNGLYYSTYDYY